jgi:NADH-quinone oxidoreductase subunit K
MLMVSVEVMFLGINLVFIFAFLINGTPTALIYSLIILSLAAAEAAIGFGLLVASFRNKPNIEFKAFNRLKG